MHRAFALALALIATPAFAQAVLPIDGIYGNVAGCTYFFTGNPVGEDLLLLTPDTLSTQDVGCDFLALIEHTQTVYAISAICWSKSKGREVGQRVIVNDLGSGGYRVTLPDGTEVGPALNCPGTEGLVAPPGVLI